VIGHQGQERASPRHRVDAAYGLAILSILLSLSPQVSASTIETPTQDSASMGSLKSMSLDELLSIRVTSVSKTAEPLADAPAAIYVITHEDILASGASSIPDMLRLAPNLQVAQITASSFAITARGFNGSAASKLLVLVDGRSVYTPYHSGVSWDVQDVPADNIERIEVISGPGATLWGANAVNGVINIITRKSGDAQGGLLQAAGGNLEQRADLQYGGKLTGDISYRLYVDSYRHGNDVTASGANAQDNWHKSQGGFRLDWAPPGDLVTVQGDYYGGSEDRVTPPEQAVSGGNLLARWNHELADGSTLRIQTYYDYAAVAVPGFASDYLNTYDLDVQHSFAWGPRQNIVWGAGARIETDNFPTVLSSTEVFEFSPQRRTLNYVDLFVQDSISLTETLKLILGTKLEDDPYTGIEPLPSARLSWKFSDSNLLWGAVSRAVRAPSRIDRDLFEVVGPVVAIKGGDFQPEKLIAYEVGYRAQPISKASLSISTFYNVYSDLRSLEASPGGVLPIMFANLMSGTTYGVEIWSNYQVATWWRLAAGANWLHEDLHFKPGSSGLGGSALAGDDPNYQVSLRSTMNLAPHWQISLDLRRIGALPNPASPAYTEAGTQIAWMISPSVELSLVGANLLHQHHLEFGTAATPIQLGPTGVESGRSVQIVTRLRF
jgi:iron complex outermembrane receptor protein